MYRYRLAAGIVALCSGVQLSLAQSCDDFKGVTAWTDFSCNLVVSSEIEPFNNCGAALPASLVIRVYDFPSSQGGVLLESSNSGCEWREGWGEWRTEFQIGREAVFIEAWRNPGSSAAETQCTFVDSQFVELSGGATTEGNCCVNIRGDISTIIANAERKALSAVASVTSMKDEVLEARNQGLLVFAAMFPNCPVSAALGESCREVFRNTVEHIDQTLSVVQSVEDRLSLLEQLLSETCPSASLFCELRKASMLNRELRMCGDGAVDILQDSSSLLLLMTSLGRDIDTLRHVEVAAVESVLNILRDTVCDWLEWYFDDRAFCTGEIEPPRSKRGLSAPDPIVLSGHVDEANNAMDSLVEGLTGIESGVQGVSTTVTADNAIVNPSSESPEQDEMSGDVAAQPAASTACGAGLSVVMLCVVSMWVIANGASRRRH